MSSVYAVSVDSRSRNINEPDNSYTVNLGRTLDRVKTIQLGSFQFQDERYAFDSNSEMKYSEPITIPPDTYLSFRETTTTLTKSTNAVTTSTRDLSILLPPTMNQITGMVGDVVTATENTGLFFAANYYGLVGLNMQVVGADFPQDLQAFVTPSFPTNAGPLLTSATTNAPYVTDASNSFTYTTDYLDELMGGVGDKVLRHFSAGAYTSYVHAPKPTLVELVIMLNAATSDLTRRADVSDTVTGATNATPIVITTSVANGLVTGDQVVISGVTGNTAANGTFIITAVTSSSFELDGSVGNGAYGGGGTLFSPQQLNMSANFGFDNESNMFTATAPIRVSDTPLTTVTRKLTFIGPLASLLGFNDVNMDPPAHVNVTPLIKRIVPLRAGTYTPDQVELRIQYDMNPTSFGGLAPANLRSQRTFLYILPNGVQDKIVIDYGFYTGQQLADYMTSKLEPLPSQIVVTYNEVDGTFTFTHKLGLTFGLIVDNSNTIRFNFGFETGVLSNRSSYTSIQHAVKGVAVGGEFPENTYDLVVDEASKHFTFKTIAPESIRVVGGTSTSNVNATWNPTVNVGLSGAERGSTPLAHRFRVGDVLTATRSTLSSTQAGSAAITNATNASPIVITTAGAHGLTTGDNVSIDLIEGNEAGNGTFFVTVTGATTFELNGSSGSGTYITDGEWWTNVSFVSGSQKPSAIYTVVVQSVWDATTGVPLLTLEPTASIFSIQDAGTASRDALGTPGEDARINLKHARRNVFMLHFEHPEGAPDTFGFPPVAWPPSEKAILSASTIGRQVLRTLPEYDPVTLSIPVSNSYTAPFSWNLLPPDYMLIVLKVTCAANDIHTHSYRGTSFPIFAKMMITFPFISVSEEMLFTKFAGHARIRDLVIEFQNPDGSLVDFNGRPHTFTLLFTVNEDKAILPCF